MKEESNREILIRAASLLFRQKGYDGVGLNEILAASGLPKGSLYYHFPSGKRELAEAATLWANGHVERAIDKAFGEARSFEDGAAEACRTLAKLADGGCVVAGCPVFALLGAGPTEPRLRDLGERVLKGWISRIGAHARRLNHPSADIAAEILVMQFEGAWMLAMAEQSAGPFERLEQWVTRGAVDA